MNNQTSYPTVKKEDVSVFYGEGTVKIVIKIDALMTLLQMDEFEPSPLGVVRLSSATTIKEEL